MHALLSLSRARARTEVHGTETRTIALGKQIMYLQYTKINYSEVA